MGRFRTLLIRAMLFAPLFVTAAGPIPASAPPPRIASADLDGAQPVSIMTYNVEGLPWPIRFGRTTAAREIGDRLAALRREGAQPHILVLQEAFGAEQKAIGERAGYRYRVDGPGEADRNPAAMAAETPADRAYLAHAHRLRGEGWGKWAGSGLVLYSDYPILAVRSTVFPDYACAGFDCLANKGALMAVVAVPGSPQPVAVVATHLNSKTASGVGKARYTYAFSRQMDVLGGFLREALPAGVPYVIAGDTNVGAGATRAGLFGTMVASLPRTGAPGVNALTTCLAPGSTCRVDTPDEARRSHEKGKDLEVYGSGTAVRLQPVTVSVPFGHGPDGSMLSDHIGYAVGYAMMRDDEAGSAKERPHA